MTERQWKRLLTQSEYVIDSKEGGVWVPTKSIYDARYEGEVFPGIECVPADAISGGARKKYM